MPPLITLAFMPMCPTLTPCGGPVVGSWEYTSGCVSTDTLFGQIKQQACSTLTFSNLTGDSRGSVIFTASNVTRNIKTNIAGTANIPASCNAFGCSATQTALANVFKTVTCTAAGGGCTCDFTYEAAVANNVPYTSATNQFTTEPGTGQAKTYDYCIAGVSPVFTYRELGNNPRDPGVFVMGKK